MHQTEFIDLKLRIIHFTKAHKIDFQNENLHQKCVVDCQKKNLWFVGQSTLGVIRRRNYV